MRPDPSPLPHRDGARRLPVLTGVNHRPEGQARALARAAAYRGFTQAVPNIPQLCRLLSATARRHGIGAAALQTLTVMLGLLPSGRWHTLPVLRLSNQRIADAVGCSSRTVQRHLKQLHEQGVIGVAWGPGNTRLPCRQDGGGRAEPVGIDLRPALVLGQEAAALVQATEAARRAFHAAHDAASEAILAARDAAGTHADQPPASTLLERLTGLRQELQAATRRSHRAAAPVASIEAATAAVTAIAAEAEALRRALDHEPGPPGGGGDRAEDSASSLSPGPDTSGHQETGSTGVESPVPTIQGPGRTAAKGWGGQGEPDDPAAPLLYGRWLGAYQGTRPLPGGELVELEITARLRAKAMGLATRVVNQAIERHGVGLVIGAVLFVAALPETAQIRSRSGLLVSLLRREPGRLTPETFHRRPAADPQLGQAEALGIAARLAPSHRPHWVVGRWYDTRRRKGERIHSPRRCLAAFARKLEREQGRSRHVS